MCSAKRKSGFPVLRISILSGYFVQGWQEALQWKVFSWLSPQEPIRLIKPTGEEVTVIFTSEARAKPSRGKPKLLAVALPDDLLLRRTAFLPRLGGEEIKQVIEQESIKASPFVPENTVWGYSCSALDATRCRIDYVVTARDFVQRHLASLHDRIGGHVPEVWAGYDGVIVLRGFGEIKRAQRLVLRRWAVVCMLALALILGGGYMLTPTIQLRARAIQAVMAYESLQRASGPQVKQRDALQVANDCFEEGVALIASPVEHVVLIEEISKALADDTWLSELRVHGNVVQISGETTNSSRLMQSLGTVSAYREVKALSAFSKALGGVRENFSIEFKVVR